MRYLLRYSNWLLLESEETLGYPWNLRPDLGSLGERLVRMARRGDYGDKSRVARNPETPPYYLEELSTVDQEEKRLDVSDIVIQVAQNPNTPAKALHRLAGHEDVRVQLGVANNPNVSEETLWELGHNDLFQLRYAVARNPKCSSRLLMALSEDPTDTVIEMALRHPNMPIDRLQSFADSPAISNEWKGSIAGNPSSTPEVLMSIWKKTKFSLVLLKLIANPNCPLSILVRESRSLIDRHREAAQDRLGKIFFKDPSAREEAHRIETALDLGIDPDEEVDRSGDFLKDIDI